MTVTSSLPRRTVLTAIAAAAVLALGACGNKGDKADVASASTATSAPATAAPGNHNRADTTFAQQMIVHHRQAIEMADLAEKRASSSKVKTLAAKIEKEQKPEIKTMSGWLKSWGEKVPQGMSMSMPGMNHGSPSATPSVPGMMNDRRMREMMQTSGKAFDTMFLTMMIKHHQGAIDMAKAEKKHGSYDPAKALAGDIVTAQSAEITQMRKMLGHTS
ncbi:MULTISPECIES: DUF305 domain-containing protein [Streptomyces]|uniref:DUF305 domain-containing protein n=1 Tax=Streptomyces lycopersici TaxID=2974589 RepID=UPI0021CEEE51|nr:DUF305 domain-containing protein [Streptomyces sp. NEAU-383]